MAQERVVVSTEEISQVQAEPDAPSANAPRPSLTPPLTPFRKLPSPVPWWARVVLSFLVLALPLLCLLTILLRVAFRTQPARVRYAWVSFLSTLLVISGLLTVAAGVVFISIVPVPAMVNTGLPELDERTQFPSLPSAAILTSSDASAELKPLVIVVSPAARLWNHQEVPSAAFGAGVLLYANNDGYLFATANHVADLSGSGIHAASSFGSSSARPNHALIATAAGVWATADVIAQAPELDLALLWIGRHGNHDGNSKQAQPGFLQPLIAAKDGEDVFVIGHPEGLRYTLSTGIVSGIRDEAIQVSAAISPGNSGGPVYDNHGNLLGIVSSKFDHNRDANAENLSFAAKADAILKPSVWSFHANGQKLLETYIAATKAAPKPTNEPQDLKK